MLKKSIFIGMVSVLSAFDSFAAINGEDIPFTSEVMEVKESGGKGLPVTLADALAAIRSGVISEIRNYGNIRYNKTPNSGKSPVEAQNEGLDDVAQLLISLFPSNGGVPEISTNHDENFAKVLSEIKNLNSEKSHEIIAELLNVCRQARNGEELSEMEDKINGWVSGLSNKRRGGQSLTKMFKTVADSASFEGVWANLLYYPPHMTETLILAFCCYFFDGSAGDVKKLMDAMKNHGLIDDYSKDSIFLDGLPDDVKKAKLEQYEKEITDIVRKTSRDINGPRFTLQTPITLEQYLYITSGKAEIVPYPDSAFFEQNLTVTCRTENKILNFSDCVETAVRHLITMMCKYDAEKDIIKAPDSFNEKVKEFFKKYKRKSFTNGRVQVVHNDWALLCREIPGAYYSEKDGSLRSDWRNVLRVLKYLTGSSVEIPEKIEENVPFLSEITKNCRDDVTFEFEKVPPNRVKCTITPKTSSNPEAKQSGRPFCFIIDVHTGHSALSSIGNATGGFLYRLMELENGESMKALMVERFLMPRDNLFEGKLWNFWHYYDNYLAKDYLDYLNGCSLASVPAGSVFESAYDWFMAESLGKTLFNYTDLANYSDDSAYNLLEPIEVVTGWLYREKENEISEAGKNVEIKPKYNLLQTHCRDAHYRDVKEYEDSKTSHFITIINHLTGISGDLLSRAASALRAMKAILARNRLVLTNITGEDRLNFLRQNTVCDVLIKGVTHPDEFVFTAPEKGALLEISESNFQKGGRLDLSKCGEAKNYTYQIVEKVPPVEYREPTENILESGEIGTVISLPANKVFSLKFIKKQ
jgi:hypothetical protein